MSPMTHVLTLLLGLTTTGADTVGTATGQTPDFDALLSARFDDAGNERYAAFKSWAWTISPDETARWYARDGTTADGKPRWKTIVPCAVLDSRGEARAMVAALDTAPDRATAERRWAEVERVRAAMPAAEARLTADARRKAAKRRTEIGRELAMRAAADQAVRVVQSDRPHDDATEEAILYRLGAEECHVDTDNVLWLKAVVAAGRWPTIARDGKAAAGEAWLLAQHADDDRSFQRAVLVLLRPLVVAGEADGKDYALLFDRVAIGSGRPQRYATQFTRAVSGCLEASPTEDPREVDARRQSIGLAPVSRYARKLSKAFHTPVCAALFPSERSKDTSQ